MSKYLLMADVHAHAWTQFATVDSEGLNSRLQSTLHAMRSAANFARKNGVGEIVVAGDLFHVRGSLTPSTLNAVKAEMESSGVDWTVLAGNHDLESADSRELTSATTAVSSRRVMSVTQTLVSGVTPDGFVLIPWQPTRGQFLAEVDRVKAQIVARGAHCSNYDLICHVGIDGVLSGVPGQFSAEELSNLGFYRVFSGHYHHHAVFTFGETKVVSIGALTHQTWSDVGTLAGFLVVSEDGFERIETGAPRFVDFTAIDDVEDAKGCFVRVRGLELTEPEIAETRAMLEAVGALGVVFDVRKKTEVSPRGEAARSMTMECAITGWVAKTSHADRAAITRDALAVLSEVREA